VQNLSFFVALAFALGVGLSCAPVPAPAQTPAQITLGDARMEAYLPLLEGRTVGVVCNHTAVVDGVHLVDTLLSRGVHVTAAFAPEHGFRGRAAAGAHIENGVDPVSGIAIHSLYGRTKKPTPEMIAGLDLLLFDIQDVGARFYTYLSTLHYVMESAAEHGIPLIVLDRPNPNGALTDGPMLDTNFRSFVGMHPIPLAHGMTLGELAAMINGEGWISAPCDLTVIDCSGWARNDAWNLPIAPSPNLPNANSIALYPSLCLFEATVASIGRGTDRPFECVGHPDFKGEGVGDVAGYFTFTPRSCEAAPHPKHEGKLCNGLLLDAPTAPELNLKWLVDFIASWGGEGFIDRPGFFDKLAGTDRLRIELEAGKPWPEIRAAWAPGLAEFKERRAPYLRYHE
jgi:uncharacterized protein YbbC (DUF1343 family)